MPAASDSAAKPKRITKGQRTRALILDKALELFRDNGYDATTMRMIAEAAGMSVGSAYYYFPSKDHLVQAFYGKLRAAHQAGCEDLLATVTDLDDRLGGALHALIDVMEPYHVMSGHLFRSVADPDNPLNPFSDESKAVRGEATALMAEVLYGSTAKPAAEFRDELPELLWLLQMAVILFWLHDRSKGHKRTRKLIDHATATVCRLIDLSGKPWMKPVRGEVLKLLSAMRGAADDGDDCE